MPRGDDGFYFNGLQNGDDLFCVNKFSILDEAPRKDVFQRPYEAHPEPARAFFTGQSSQDNHPIKNIMIMYIYIYHCILHVSVRSLCSDQKSVHVCDCIY